MMKIHTIDLKFRGVKEAIASFLIEGENNLALVETGPHSTFPNLKKGVEALGFQIEDIRHVFISHIQLDHAGAAWAVLHLQPTIPPGMLYTILHGS